MDNPALGQDLEQKDLVLAGVQDHNINAVTFCGPGEGCIQIQLMLQGEVLGLGLEIYSDIQIASGMFQGRVCRAEQISEKDPRLMFGQDL